SARPPDGLRARALTDLILTIPEFPIPTSPNHDDDVETEPAAWRVAAVAADARADASAAVAVARGMRAQDREAGHDRSAVSAVRVSGRAGYARSVKPRRLRSPSRSLEPAARRQRQGGGAQVLIRGEGYAGVLSSRSGARLQRARAARLQSRAQRLR